MQIASVSKGIGSISLDVMTFGPKFDRYLFFKFEFEFELSLGESRGEGNGKVKMIELREFRIKEKK